MQLLQAPLKLMYGLEGRSAVQLAKTCTQQLLRPHAATDKLRALTRPVYAAFPTGRTYVSTAKRHDGMGEAEAEAEARGERDPLKAPLPPVRVQHQL